VHAFFHVVGEGDARARFFGDGAALLNQPASGQKDFGATRRISIPILAAPTIRELPMLLRASPR
jgi:hypothetical protein